MNRNIGTNPNRMLGATISADNRTYGLAPARPAGQPETVAEIADPYCLTVITTAGNCYRNGNFTVLRFADAVENAIRSQGEFVTVARIALAEAVAR